MYMCIVYVYNCVHIYRLMEGGTGGTSDICMHMYMEVAIDIIGHISTALDALL